MPHISDLLDKYQNLGPLPTGLLPRIHGADHRPKALLFDLYGTLMISASGDIDKSRLNPDDLMEAAQILHLPFPTTPDFFTGLLDLYRREIITKKEKLLWSSDSKYPEIDIIEIWTCILQKLATDKMIAAMPSKSEVKNIALVFEICTNPTAPMPEMREIILALRASGIRRGIISNAQFYTPILCRYFLTGQWDGRPNLREWFNPLLSFFSYRECRSKPDPQLFQEMCAGLAQYAIRPEEALFIGNDVLKDLLPAAAVGLQTVLFAGDARSLRLHAEDPAAARFQADYVITELRQLKEICGL